MNAARDLVILAGQKRSTNIIYNFLKRDFQIKKVILEKPPSRIDFLRKKVQSLGLSTVIGQILFRVLVVPCLNLSSRKRIEKLKKKFGLSEAPIEKDKILKVRSVNSRETMAVLRKINPAAVFVSGTRVITEEVINCIGAKFVNLHTGITPSFRGVHGAYWSLTEKKKELCGVTVHLIDTGIDTGGILEQGLIKPAAEDNFVTYQFLQLAVGAPLLRKAVLDVCENRINIKSYPERASRLWTHPTLWEYIYYRFRRGVK